MNNSTWNKLIWFAPWLLTHFFLLNNAVQLELYVSFKEYLISCFVIGLAQYTCLFFVNKILSKESSILFISVLSFLFFFYSQYYYFLKDILPLQHRYLVFFIFALLCLLFLGLKSFKQPLNKLNSFILLLFGILSLFEISKGAYLHSQGLSWKKYISIEDKIVEIENSASNTPQPNIYFIVLDAYMNPGLYQEIYLQNQDSFLNDLSQQKFDIYLNSKSSYDETLFSIASCLNEKREPDLSDIKNEITKNTICRVWINNNKIAKSYIKKGYQIQNYSFFDVANTPAYSDFDYLMLHGLSFYKHIFKKTLPGKIYSDTYFSTLSIYRSKEILEKVINDPYTTSKFYYIHLLLPHRPYYFDGDAKVYLDGLGKFPKDEKRSYQEQLFYSQKLITQFINDIDKKDAKATIILSSDHSPKIAKEYVADPLCSLRNLLAIKTRNSTGIKDSITPISYNDIWKKVNP